MYSPSCLTRPSMKCQVFLLLSFCYHTTLAWWSTESGVNHGDIMCPKGQALSGIILKNIEGDPEGPSHIREFSEITARIYCSNLDGTSRVYPKAFGVNLAGITKRAWTLKEGSKVTDQDKNCDEGTYITGIKLSENDGSPSIALLCSKDKEYELDGSIEPRMIGPMRFRHGMPAQVLYPAKSTDNGRCQLDAAVALGVDDVGVRLKIASFKRKGKSYNVACKAKKEEATVEANKAAVPESEEVTEKPEKPEKPESGDSEKQQPQGNSESNNGGQNNNGQTDNADKDSDNEVTPEPES